jgi:hypothetical protein
MKALIYLGGNRYKLHLGNQSYKQNGDLPCTLYYPAMPTGVASFKIYRDGMEVVTNPTSSGAITVSYGGAVYATATATSDRVAPSISGIGTFANGATTMLNNLSVQLSAGLFNTYTVQLPEVPVGFQSVTYSYTNDQGNTATKTVYATDTTKPLPIYVKRGSTITATGAVNNTNELKVWSGSLNSWTINNHITLQNGLSAQIKGTPTVTATASTANSVTLKVTGAYSNPDIGLALYRSTSQNGSYTMVGSPSFSSSATITSSGLASSTSYYWKACYVYRTGGIVSGEYSTPIVKATTAAISGWVTVYDNANAVKTLIRKYGTLILTAANMALSLPTTITKIRLTGNHYWGATAIEAETRPFAKELTASYNSSTNSYTFSNTFFGKSDQDATNNSLNYITISSVGLDGTVPYTHTTSGSSIGVLQFSLSKIEVYVPSTVEEPEEPEVPEETTEYAVRVNSIDELYYGDRILFAYDGDGIDCVTGPVTSTSVIRFAGLDVADLRIDPETIQVSEEMTTFRIESDYNNGYNLYCEDLLNNGYIIPSSTSNRFSIVSEAPDSAWEIAFGEGGAMITAPAYTSTSRCIVYNLQNNYFTFAVESSTAVLPKIYKIVNSNSLD